MSICNVLSPEILERSQAGTLSRRELAALRDHLRAPCAACLDTLAGMDPARFLLALAGPAAKLSSIEAGRLFEGSLSASRRRPDRWQRGFAGLRRGLQWRSALAAAVVLVALLPAVLYWQAHRSTGAAWTGIKAGQPPAPPLSVMLHVFVASPEQAARGQTRRYAAGDPWKRGELLLFRYQLSRPAHLYLWDAESHTLLFGPDPGTARVPAGEGELTASGRALALEGSRLTRGGTLVLLAAPDLLPHAELEQLVHGKPGASLCRGCAADRLRVARWAR